MNQILLTENKNDKNKNNKYINRTNKKDMRKIVIFFGVAILVFGIALAGVYGYRAYNKNKKKEVIVGKPDLSLESTEEFVTIIAKSEIGIDKIIYTWNEDEPKEIEMSGRTSHEEKIDIPNGENTLNVKVVDQKGQEKEKSKEFINDKEKPIIETSIVENAQLKITATDNFKMNYITYKWNEEEEVKIDVENEEDQIIETTIDVKRGKNTITITAVDSVDNVQIIDKTFNGVNEPVIDVLKKQDKLYMKISHDMGFEKIEFSVNGKVYSYDSNYSGYDSTQKVIEYQFDLKEGENTVIIVADSTEGTQAIYKGKCEHHHTQE